MRTRAPPAAITAPAAATTALPAAMAALLLAAGCNAIEWTLEPPPEAGASSAADAPNAELGPDSPGIDFLPSPPWAVCIAGSCPIPGLQCDPSSGQCVPCLDDSDCSDRTLNACDLVAGDRLQNECVECVFAGDCGPGEACVAYQCVTTCNSNHDCKASAANCDPSRNICISCRESGDCSKGHVCNAATGRCGGCTSDIDCDADKPRCDPRTNACVRCLNSLDCNGGVCDPESESCVGHKM